MAIINSSVLSAAYKSFKAIFNGAAEAADESWKDLVTIVPSEAEEENYGWLCNLAGMREWVGDRVIQGLKAFGWSIKNKFWELTISVKREEYLFDKLGQVKARIEELAQTWNDHTWELIEALLVNGFSSLCYDGQNFFDTDHLECGESVSNKGTKKLTMPSLSVAIANLKSRRREDGKPMRVGRKLILIVGPQEETNAKNLLTADTIGGTTNTMKGIAELKVLPGITGTQWFVGDFGRAVRPLILQIVKKGEFVAMDDPASESVFMRREYLYGVDSIDNAGYGLWQLMYGSTGAES